MVSSWGKDLRSDLIDIIDANGCLMLKGGAKETNHNDDDEAEKKREEGDTINNNNSRVLQGHTKSIVDMKVCYSKGLAASVSNEEEGTTPHYLSLLDVLF